MTADRTLGDETVGAAVAGAAATLADAGIGEARREARLLVALAIEADPAIVLGYPERPMAERARRRLACFVGRRAAHEPLSRLRGQREFWSLDFTLSPDTLDPRPDSETVIESALAVLPDRQAPLTLIDFGTGSGCLLLALLSELPRATGLGVDISWGAARTARRNAARLGLHDRARFVVGDWDTAIGGAADVILANPPYIRTADLSSLAPEVRDYDPKNALDGGDDGLQAYRALAKGVKRLLAPDGIALFEVGEGQAEAVAQLAVCSGLKVLFVRADLSGIARCVGCGPA